MPQLLLTVLGFISLLLTISMCVIMVYAMMNWLTAFHLVSTRNQGVRILMHFLYRITQPALRPIRSVLPNLDRFDISPIIMSLVIILVQMLILPFVASLTA